MTEWKVGDHAMLWGQRVEILKLLENNGVALVELTTDGEINDSVGVWPSEPDGSRWCIVYMLEPIPALVQLAELAE